MYGKHFAHMYEGSMVGSGPVIFAVMGYVIAKQVPDRTYGSVVELNPKLLAFVLGCEEDEVASAVEKLCSPDPSSRTKEKEGRRLVKIGQFSYHVVNGAKYRAIRDEETRKQQNREAQQRFREKKSKPAPGEAAYVRALESGASDAELNRLAEPTQES